MSCIRTGVATTRRKKHETTKNNVAKLVLMSILTVATSFGFTACSSDDELFPATAATDNRQCSRPGAPIECTVLVYMAGCNNLSKCSSNAKYLNARLVFGCCCDTATDGTTANLEVVAGVRQQAG